MPGIRGIRSRLALLVLFASACSSPKPLPLPAAPPLRPGMEQPPPPPPPPDRTDPAIDLKSFVSHFIGSEPVDCGMHRRGMATIGEAVKVLETSVACAIEQSQRRNPFWTFRAEFQTDTWVARGLLGRADGEIFHFDYDSSVCGASGGCSQFAVSRCKTPSVFVEQLGPRRSLPYVGFGCAR